MDGVAGSGDLRKTWEPGENTGDQEIRREQRVKKV